jgi:hypothetical protein
MTTPADVVGGLSKLIDDLARLLETKVAKAAPAIALELGAEAQFAQGVNSLGAGLDQIRLGVLPVQRALLDADALVALFGFVPGLVSATGDAVANSGAYLADLGLGLGSAAEATSAINGQLHEVSGILEVGVDVAEAALDLVAPDRWIGVVAGLDHLRAAVTALKTLPPAVPA